jgi:hypothetical protein
MNVSIFLAIKAVISILTGLSFLLIPAYALSFYDVSLPAEGLFFARLFSAMALGIGGICWFARTMPIESRQAVILSLFVADTIGLIVTLMAQSQGLVNSLGWVNVAIWVFLVGGLGYFRFVSKA